MAGKSKKNSVAAFMRKAKNNLAMPGKRRNFKETDLAYDAA
jgi:hypothetical protein